MGDGERGHFRRRQPVHRGLEEWDSRVLQGLGQLEHGFGMRDWLAMRWGDLVCLPPWARETPQ